MRINSILFKPHNFTSQNIKESQKSTSPNNIDINNFFKITVSIKNLNERILEGSIYNTPFNIKVNKSNIIGNIGNKNVKIDIISDGAFTNNCSLKGYIGNKDVDLKRKFGIISTNEEVNGKFGNENINFAYKTMYPFVSRTDKLIGEGINLELFYCDSKPFKLLGKTKIYGKYEKDPEFLPILMALYKIQ